MPDANLSTTKTERSKFDTLIGTNVTGSGTFKDASAETVKVEGTAKVADIKVSSDVTTTDMQVNTELEATNVTIAGNLQVNTVTATPSINCVNAFASPMWQFNTARSFPVTRIFNNFVPGAQTLGGAVINLLPQILKAGTVRLIQNAATLPSTTLILPSATDLVFNLNLQPGDMFVLHFTFWRDANPVFKDVVVEPGTGGAYWNTADALTKTFNNFAIFHFYFDTDSSYNLIRVG